MSGIQRFNKRAVASRTLVLSGVMILVITGVLVAIQSPSPPPPLSVASPRQPSIDVDPESLLLRDVWGGAREWTIRVTNQESVPVDFTGFSASCSCRRLTKDSFTLAPRQTADIKLALDLRLGDPVDFAQIEPGALEAIDFRIPYSAIVTPQFQFDAETPAAGREWRLHGRYELPAVFSKRQLVLGRVIEGDEERAHETLEFVCHPEIREAQIEVLDSNQFELTSEKVSESPAVYSVDVFLKNTATPGFHKSAVRVTGLTSTGEKVPPVEISLEADLLPRYSAVPRNFLLGRVPLGEPIEKTGRIHSRDGKFELLGAASDSNDVTVKTTGIDDSEKRPGFLVRVTPSARRNGLCSVQIQVENTETGDVHVVPVHVSWYAE